MRCGHIALALGALTFGAATLAQTVSMSGAFTDKALLMIDGAARTVAVGSTVQGVKLLSVNGNAAVVEVQGKRVALTLGAAQVNLGRAAGAGAADASRIVLSAGPGGHFMTGGAINGKAVRFMVDTGASMIGIGQPEAEALGIDFRKGQRGMAGTAGGSVAAYLVSLASVQVGEVTLYEVEALVIPGTMPYVLLGNSFLNRFQMQRDSNVMTLTRRF